MASQAYMANMNLKKQKQAEELWNKINDNKALGDLAKLHKQIKTVEKSRKDNRDTMEETYSNYQALKKNIKDFIRTQNVDKKKR